VRGTRYLVIVNEAITYPHERNKVEIDLPKDSPFHSAVDGLRMLGDKSSSNIFVSGGDARAIIP